MLHFQPLEIMILSQTINMTLRMVILLSSKFKNIGKSGLKKKMLGKLIKNMGIIVNNWISLKINL